MFSMTSHYTHITLLASVKMFKIKHHNVHYGREAFQSQSIKDSIIVVFVF